MQQHGSGCLGDVSNCSFSNAILEMGIDSTEGDPLSALLTVLQEQVVSKMTIVTMIMLDANAVLPGKSLKGTLGLNGLLGCE